MTKQKSFKDRIRARMDKTGESYATARRQLIEKSEPAARKRKPQTISPTRPSDESVRAATGRTLTAWFARLDKWGAKDKKHGEIARWLSEDEGVAGWWAQSVTVAYEQERGLRAPGQRSDGTYGVSASKTIEVDVDDLFDAFHDDEIRERWLGEVELDVRTVRPGKSLTAGWEDGSTRIAVWFTDKGSAKSQVALEHQKVVDAGHADELKGFWRERLSSLKKLLEG